MWGGCVCVCVCGGGGSQVECVGKEMCGILIVFLLQNKHESCLSHHRRLPLSKNVCVNVSLCE